jgi:transcriptional regulator with PAS, ATPase and Fis domain
LFLDEIGNLPLELQPRLLTALQDRQVTRVGSNLAREVDIRLVSASSLPLVDRVAEGRLRQELLYRINTVEIPLPPLRERRQDIPLLAEHFQRLYAARYHKRLGPLPAATLRKLDRYHWPGNVRELQHAMERAVIMSGSRSLRTEDVVLTAAERGSGELVVDSLNLEQVEKATIRKALAKHEGNVSRAARELGLTRTSLYRRLERYGL